MYLESQTQSNYTRDQPPRFAYPGTRKVSRSLNVLPPNHVCFALLPSNVNRVHTLVRNPSVYLENPPVCQYKILPRFFYVEKKRKREI